MKPEVIETCHQMIKQLLRMSETRTVPEIEYELFRTQNLKDEVRYV